MESLIIWCLMVMVLPLTAVPCRDKRQDCLERSFDGQCGDYPKFMLTNCPKSCEMCSACNDKSTKCIKYAVKKLCQSRKRGQRAWMARNCKRSCGRCPDCRDASEVLNCVKWANDGYCTNRFKAYMEVACKRSCGKCPSECKDSVDEYCPWRKAYGECQTKKEMMQKSCPKSCGFCKEYGLVYKYKFDSAHTSIKGARNCGDRGTGRIVGGGDAKKGNWPWQVAIAYKASPKSVLCGGSLINSQWVLTASHCFGLPDARIAAKNYIIRLGDHDLQVDEASEVKSGVSKIVRHSAYSIKTMDSDIALIKLARPVTFSKYIKPICLPKKHLKEPVGQKCFIVGWGKLGEENATSNILQVAQVPIEFKPLCSYVMRNMFSNFTENMICGGSGSGKIDACQGDSGGPIVCHVSKRYQLTGITSFGQGCARNNTYGIYTKTSMFIDWIKENINN
eukprot:Seg531.1 transcript_id=Seg531.1/GoldUCD/mRNA.D3Y31 product="Plasma kallikrein" protein_id=Seg531.1/GoldUCD/D3Y31